MIEPKPHHRRTGSQTPPNPTLDFKDEDEIFGFHSLTSPTELQHASPMPHRLSHKPLFLAPPTRDHHIWFAMAFLDGWRIRGNPSSQVFSTCSLICCSKRLPVIFVGLNQASGCSRGKERKLHSFQVRCSYLTGAPLCKCLQSLIGLGSNNYCKCCRRPSKHERVAGGISPRYIDHIWAGLLQQHEDHNKLICLL